MIEKVTKLSLLVRNISVGRYVPFPTASNPNTQRHTGYKASWGSRYMRFYDSKRCETPEEAATLAYKWFDRQNRHGMNFVDTTETNASWNRKNASPR